ncbi:MAG: glycosyltransferase [Alphaproteobacteria bacterium]|nr:MAG: glycosyltransferase [Alphaproteobacteria bacterium]
MSAARLPSVCIIAHNAYGAIKGDGTGHIGGAEHQTALLARWLTGKGYKTMLLTWKEGQPDDCIINGVRVMGICKANAGVPGFRFIHPRSTGLFSAMARADADIYYHNSAEPVTGLAAAWCRMRNRRFVYSVASDVACERHLPTLKGLRDRWLYRYGLHHADTIIVQTNKQAELLQQSFGLKSSVLPMPCGFSPATQFTGNSPLGLPRVAWVGRIDRMKRLEWLLDVAEGMPKIEFDVVGANIQAAAARPHLANYARLLHERATALPNVHWHGGLPHDAVTEIYRKAICLCCTSSYEGFPNTFLEAWSQARPVVSSFDPDGIIHNRKLGFYGTSVAELAAAISRLTASGALWKELSNNALSYFTNNHALDVSMPRYERTILPPVTD